MKHEIVTVSSISGSALYTKNYLNEKYIIHNISKYKIKFKKDQKIGISYTSKTMTEEGYYELSIVDITKEGDGKLAPNEK